ncbi:unnamed protein product [Orchesella dallaii]|uniref:Uncharacterized protein n=1 Tax=Orchesella dallaii TaxID=48710 RepID=A0ABP1S664_9HEXA
MQNLSLLLFGAVLCVVYVTVSAHGGGGGGGEMKKKMMEKFKKCDDGEMNMEEMMKGKEECMPKRKKPESSENMERRRRSPSGNGEAGGKHSKGGKGGKGRGKGKRLAGSVCMLKKAGALDESGKFSETGFRSYIDKIYPENKREEAYNSAKACADKHSSSFSPDNNFVGYAEFMKCAKEGHMAICKIEMPNWGGGKKNSEEME